MTSNLRGQNGIRNMSDTSQKRSEDFLKISHQFPPGVLTTETSHPITKNLSEVAKGNLPEGLELLFHVDGDVVRKYREFMESNRAQAIQQTVLCAIKSGGRI